MSAPAPRGVSFLRTRPSAPAAAASTAAPAASSGSPAPPPPSPFAAAAAGSAAVGPFSCPGGRSSPPITLLRLAWRRYQQNLRARPLATKALTAAAVAALSDAAAQWISSAAARRPRSSGGVYDLARTLKMALLGLIWSGPSAHCWHAFLQLALPSPPPGGPPGLAALSLLKKVALDQLTYGPVCNLVFMAYSTVAVGGAGSAELARRVRRDFAAVQRNGWRVWPLASAVNYRFVPLECRVLFANVVALAWTTYLNVMAVRG